MTTAHALQTPSTPRNFCSMDAAPILATMPKPAPAKPQAPQQARVMDLFSGDTSLSDKLTGRGEARQGKVGQGGARQDTLWFVEVMLPPKVMLPPARFRPARGS